MCLFHKTKQPTEKSPKQIKRRPWWNGETRFLPWHQSRTSCEIPQWLQEFREKLVDDEILEQGDSHASSSHEVCLEPTTKRREDLGKHSVYTHFPKDRNCEACQRTKITRAPCRRRNGEAVLRAANFGDLITADHKVPSDNCESRNNHRYAVVVQDLAAQWIQACPCKNKTSQETQRSLHKFLEPDMNPKVIYADNSLEFGKACEDLSWNHCTSPPHRSETNGIAERAARRVKEGTSAVLLQSGLNESWWADSVECYTCLRNVTDLLSDGKTPYERRFGQPFGGPVVPFGSLVEYHPITAKDQSRIHQFGKKVLPGLFLGCALHAGGIWKGDVLIADLAELETMDASEIYSKRLNSKEVIFPKEKGHYFSNRTWTNQNPWRRSGIENINLGAASTNSKRIFWSISGSFIHRHHVENPETNFARCDGCVESDGKTACIQARWPEFWQSMGKWKSPSGKRTKINEQGKTIKNAREKLETNPQECVWEIQYQIIMKTTLQEKETIHNSITIWFANWFLCFKLWKFLQRKQRWTRNGKNWRKFRRGTWQKSVARKRWSMKQGRRAPKFISFHWWTFVIWRLPNWRQSTKSTKVGLYSEVILYKTIQDLMQCSLNKVISITNDSSKSHGYHIQTSRLRWTSSRRSISLYPSKNGRCSQIVENSQIGMSRHLDSSTTTQVA